MKQIVKDTSEVILEELNIPQDNNYHWISAKKISSFLQGKGHIISSATQSVSKILYKLGFERKYLFDKPTLVKGLGSKHFPFLNQIYFYKIGFNDINDFNNWEPEQICEESDVINITNFINEVSKIQEEIKLLDAKISEKKLKFEKLVFETMSDEIYRSITSFEEFKNRDISATYYDGSRATYLTEGIWVKPDGEMFSDDES